MGAIRAAAFIGSTRCVLGACEVAALFKEPGEVGGGDSATASIATEQSGFRAGQITASTE